MKGRVLLPLLSISSFGSEQVTISVPVYLEHTQIFIEKRQAIYKKSHKKRV
jgi:hypothetical protein